MSERVRLTQNCPFQCPSTTLHWPTVWQSRAVYNQLVGYTHNEIADVGFSSVSTRFTIAIFRAGSLFLYRIFADQFHAGHPRASQAHVSLNGQREVMYHTDKIRTFAWTPHELSTPCVLGPFGDLLFPSSVFLLILLSEGCCCVPCMFSPAHISSSPKFHPRRAPPACKAESSPFPSWEPQVLLLLSFLPWLAPRPR